MSAEAYAPERPANAHPGDFWKFWFGQLISNLGSSFTGFALPLLVFRLTGSALDLALSNVATLLPGLLFGLLIGAWIDRTDRKRLMIGADLARALVVALIPLMSALGMLTTWWIYAIGFVSTTLSICFVIAQTTAVASLVTQADLVTANGRIQASYSAVSVVGPLLAGVLATVMPIPLLLLFDALSFLISALALAMIRTSFNTTDRRAPAGLRRAIGEGLRYVLSHPVLRLVAILGLLLNLAVVTVGAQLVLFAKERLQVTDSQLGSLYSAQSAGVVVFALVAGRLRRHWPFSRVVLGATMLHGCLTLCLALNRWYWGAVALLALMAGLVVLLSINVQSLRQAIVPNELLGRVSSSLNVLVGLATPLGTMLGGLAIERTQNIALVYAVIGLLIFLTGFMFAFTPLAQAERYLPQNHD